MKRYSISSSYFEIQAYEANASALLSGFQLTVQEPFKRSMLARSGYGCGSWQTPASEECSEAVNSELSSAQELASLKSPRAVQNALDFRLESYISKLERSLLANIDKSMKDRLQIATF
ncbi:hypothetical protein M406DRAFT_71401 [Cryphonectria parasitica EP155]|uniref:Uncharacterized protein n=1 Tax=Cryphonectria parasitica (strain ATCC 38755 / EP155) TaxID=660469 RepID=A0A9P5CRA3_CRYP1|nr:uncharacterized protein M406DRAFT_71401 [Cryphonectria parasitica EP155]KAF3768349.1 hypothetical protein M406DRAFT_71401 [Cryphonectria parasitica EP155]